MITLRDSRARVLKRPPVKSIARSRTITRSDQTGRIHRYAASAGATNTNASTIQMSPGSASNECHTTSGDSTMHNASAGTSAVSSTRPSRCR